MPPEFVYFQHNVLNFSSFMDGLWCGWCFLLSVISWFYTNI